MEQSLRTVFGPTKRYIWRKWIPRFLRYPLWLLAKKIKLGDLFFTIQIVDSGEYFKNETRI